MKREYHRLFKSLDSLCEGETDEVAVMATIACELFSSFEHFDWVGFYRNVGGGILKVGPYQGPHGCLTIPFGKGVCGKCATEQKVQNVPDVSAVPYHIACSSTTRSEIVVPILCRGQLLAVLDIDSNTPAAFDENDESNLLKLSRYFALTKPSHRGY
jgi:GAF domain-containing protein